MRLAHIRFWSWAGWPFPGSFRSTEISGLTPNPHEHDDPYLREAPMTVNQSFGSWIQQHRKTLDLTQAELAQLVGCSVATIYKIEAGIRRPSKQIAARLAQHLAIAPADQPAFLRAARAVPQRAYSTPSPAIKTGLMHPSRLPTANLPVPPTALIGRQREVDEICDYLRRMESRLLNLSGPPGIGKTRLGLQIAAQLLDEYTDGVVFVALAALSDPALVESAIVRAIGVKTTAGQAGSEGLKDYLCDKHLLLFLDNFEQVVDAAPLLSDLLLAAPRLSILVTSRALLRISDEFEIPVQPLALPDLDRLPAPDALANIPSVALFLERARATRADFRLTATSAASVAAICVQLEGIPLTLELAAARVRFFSPQAIKLRLADRLNLLADGERDRPRRQQSLRAALSWSYELLHPDEQRLLVGLAVFVGGFTLEAAESVCGPAEDTCESSAPRIGVANAAIFTRLTRLCENNLIAREHRADDELRFKMLETIRAYTVELLIHRGDAEALRQRHANYYLSLAELAEPMLADAHEKIWLERLESDHDNLRAALRWAIDHQAAEVALRLCGALFQFWYKHSHASEGLRWLEAALEHKYAVSAAIAAKALNAAGTLARERGEYAQAHRFYQESTVLFRSIGDKRGCATVLNAQGGLLIYQGAYVEAQRCLEESLHLYRDVGDQWTSAKVLGNLGVVMQNQGRYAEAKTMYEASLAMSHEMKNTWGSAVALLNLGLVAMLQGNYRDAQLYYQDGLVLFREIGNKEWSAATLTNLGEILMLQGDYGHAKGYYEESLALTYSMGDRRAIACGLEGMAALAGAQGQPDKATRLFSAAASIRTLIGSPLPPSEQARYTHMVTAIQAQLSEDQFVQAWAEGRSMTLEQTMAYAVHEEGLDRLI
jgi:predicted ATPase/transcriptional regulator with XRE-family HTH domain